METLHFAHISDTHLTCGGSSPFMQRVAREVRDPWDNLKDCLCQLQGKALDFVLLTGDLVHEGEEEDYKALKRLLEEKLPGVLLCCAMGNHDHRLAFRRGFLGENTEDAGPYLAYTQVKGLGIITLDSPYLHGTDGTLPPDQLEFLRKSLEQKTPRGNIVILHHPGGLWKRRKNILSFWKMERCGAFLPGISIVPSTAGGEACPITPPVLWPLASIWKSTERCIPTSGAITCAAWRGTEPCPSGR